MTPPFYRGILFSVSVVFPCAQRGALCAATGFGGQAFGLCGDAGAPEMWRPPVRRAADERHLSQHAEWGNDRFIEEDLKVFAPPRTNTSWTKQQWAKLWNAWRGKPTETPPKVNFDEQLVLVVTSRAAKGAVRATLNDKGNLVVVLGDPLVEAVQKKAGGGWYYALAVIPREGIKTINGKPVKAAGAASARPTDDSLKSITERLKKLEQANAELTATVERLQKEVDQLKKK